MPPLRVGVIFGSRTTEHEVSIVTAIQAMQFLAGRHTVVPIYITKRGSWLTSPKLCRLETFKSFDPKDPELETVVITPDPGLQGILNPSPKGLLGKPKKLELDVAFPALHGMHGEDGTLQGLLELANLPYVGSGVMASSISMDKVLTKVVLGGSNLPVLDYLWFTRAEWENDENAIIERIEAKFPYPVVIKPARLGSSIGVAVASNREELGFDIGVASHFDSKILIEPCIQNRVEVNCSVLGNTDPIPSACEQPLTADTLLSFEDKYLHDQRERGMEGAKRIVPAPISPELTERIQQLAIAAFKAVDAAGIARVDFLIDKARDTVYVNEINTLPGSFAFYLWEQSGLNPQQLVDRLVELALERHQEKNRTRFSSDQLLIQNIDLLSLNKA